ncbi:MAG: Rdx family protein [Planctomycetaceae bacterium]|nr:Rdx family protein [Planctomycetaceae bacterium]
MTARLLERFKRRIASLELVPDKGGCFEVTVDGKLIYSKLATGNFPNEEEIEAEVARRLK